MLALALLLMHVTACLKRHGWTLEWADIIRDLRELEEVVHQGKRYLLRTPLKGRRSRGCAARYCKERG